MSLDLNHREARLLALAAQGLLKRAPFGKGKTAVLKAIRRLSYIQIDPISVVERAHHHTLWSRIPDYRPDLLEQLQHEGAVFEYWSHAAAYLPMEDYRFCLPKMRRHRCAEKHWFPRDPKLMAHILERLAGEGPLMSKDFAGSRPSREMWDLKPAKMALHELFISGQVMVVGRSGIQKIYDLPERVLPPDLDTSEPSPREVADHLIHRAVRAHGLIAETEITHLRQGIRILIKNRLAELIEDKQLIPLTLAGKRYFSAVEQLEQMPKRANKNALYLLSPFDNAVILRKRLKTLFEFTYQTEIYYPKNKRVYGYFSMPMLWGDRFVGRIDPKADRKSRTLLIQNAMLEDEFFERENLLDSLLEALGRYAAFNGCTRLRTNSASPLNDRLAERLEPDSPKIR